MDTSLPINGTETTAPAGEPRTRGQRPPRRNNGGGQQHGRNQEDRNTNGARGGQRSGRGGGGGATEGRAPGSRNKNPVNDGNVDIEALRGSARAQVFLTQQQRPGADQTNGATPQTEANESAVESEDVEAEVCFICASPVVHNAVAPCNHRTCHICSLRLRALYKTKACAHCRVSERLYLPAYHALAIVGS